MTNTAPAVAEATAPDGFVLMPRRLTAENGAKGALSGEFSEHFSTDCPVCNDEESDTECEICSGSGRFVAPVPVEWDTIKKIYAAAVELLAAPTPPAALAGEEVKPTGFFIKADKAAINADEVALKTAKAVMTIASDPIQAGREAQRLALIQCAIFDAISEATQPAAIHSAGLTDDDIDMVSMALRKSYLYGQTYWRQADSDYISQNKKADETEAKHDKLVDDIRAKLAALRFDVPTAPEVRREVLVGKFFLFDQERHFHPEIFATEAERDSAAKDAIEAHLSGDTGWSEEVENIVCGVITHEACKVDVRHRPQDDDPAYDEWPDHSFDEICHYEMVPVQSAPAPNLDGGEA